jgi:hypothetical protein
MIRRVLMLACALAIACPLPAAADSPIQTVAAKVPAPAAGTTETLQIGLTSVDGTTWDPQSYTIQVNAADQTGKQVIRGTATPGDTAIVTNQTTFVFADVAIPAEVSGALNLTVTIVHNGTTFVSDPVAIGVSSAGGGAAPAAKQSPISGKFASNTALKPPLGSDSTANLTVKAGERSYIASDEYSTNPGQQPLLQMQSPATMTQLGTFSPAYDTNVLSGVNGQGASWLRTWGAAHQLQATYIAAGQATTNPFEITAASYTMPIKGPASLVFTAGVEHTSGAIPQQVLVVPGAAPVPLQSASGQPFFMRSGQFAGITYQGKSDRGTTYQVHYSMINYDDALAGYNRAAEALAATLGFTWSKITWTVNYAHAGTYYPNLTAPGVTPDRETTSIAGAFTLGKVQGTATISGYRNDINAVISEANTHFWTESLAISTTLKHNEQLALNLSNGILHTTGDPTALMQGNDATSLTYTIPRGAYSYQLSYSSANQRDDQGNLTHTVQEGITVGRNASPGLSATVGITFNEVGAASAQSGSFSTSMNGSLTYVTGPLALSAAITRSLSLPNAGVAALPGVVITYGIQDQPKHFPFGFSAGLSRNLGPADYTTGTLGLVRSF